MSFTLGLLQIHCRYTVILSVMMPRHKSHHSHVNVFFRHYGGQLKTGSSRKRQEDKLILIATKGKGN